MILLAGISSRKIASPYEWDIKNNYLYNDKQFFDEAGLNIGDYALRNYDPQIGRWWQADPYDQFPSPYTGIGNNPINLVDPSGGFSGFIPCPGASGLSIFMQNIGQAVSSITSTTAYMIASTAVKAAGFGVNLANNAVANPIYDIKGNFLGTDNKGLQGAPIIMKNEDFTQGMNHEDAIKKDLAPKGGSEYYKAIKGYAEKWNFYIHYNNLKNRPDYDGFVTISEGINWAKSHPGALQKPTPDNMLYIDASKLDFGNITAEDFKNGVGESSPINLNTKGNFAAAQLNYTLASTVYALGRVDIKLLNNKGSVKIINNEATDYDWNKGGTIWRKGLINYERWSEGLNDSHGFRVFYYGIGRLRR